MIFLSGKVQTKILYRNSEQGLLIYIAIHDIISSIMTSFSCSFLPRNIVLLFIIIILLTSLIDNLFLLKANYVQAQVTDDTFFITPKQQQQNTLAQQGMTNISRTSVGNTMIGSFGNDRMSGSINDDIMILLSGADTARGNSGNDKIQGNEDVDQLYGENGDDILQGGTGSDQLYGGNGDDVIAGGSGDDFLVGGAGNDKLYGDIGDDILSGQSGADYFDCGEGVDVIIDFNLLENDDTAGNCEEIQNKE